MTPDGRLVISASEDATLKVWDRAQGRLLATLEAHAPLLGCAVAPNGRTFLAGDGAGSLHILDWKIAAARDVDEAAPKPRAPAARLPTPSASIVASAAYAPAGRASPGAAPPTDRIKILFLAANPTSTKELQLTREARRIQERIRGSAARVSLDLVPRWAVRRSDLQRLLLEEEPHVLHFSSHGSPRGQLLLEDDDGNVAPVEKGALVNLIGLLQRNLRLVVINACDTEPLAAALVQHVACAIGMRRAISDEAASAFAGSFYQALAFAQPIEKAFRLGCNELELNRLPAEDRPCLKVKPGVDAATLVLA